MAKGRIRSRVDAAEAPKGAVTETVVDKEPAYMASDNKGVGDAPADDVVISAPVHCDGCARKLRRSLQRLDGVGEVSVDSRTNTVVLIGPGAVENATEAVRVVERKTGRKATLLNPSPDKLPMLAAVKGAQTKKQDAVGDIGDEIAEVDTDMVVVLRINLHCDACCHEMTRRILKIEGVKEAAPLLKSSQMVVKGRIEPATLAGFIHRSTGRKAAIIRAEPLDLLPTAKSSPIDTSLVAAETKDEVPSVDSGEKKDAHDREMKEAAEEVQNRGEGDNHADERLPREEKPIDNHGNEDHETHNDGEAPVNEHDGIVLENHKKDDHLFRAPLPAGVVTVAPEKALYNLSPCYACPPDPYPYQHHFYQCPQQYPYPYSSAVYGYPHYPLGPLSEENPNACTVM